jgi:hypothetical protein
MIGAVAMMPAAASSASQEVAGTSGPSEPATREIARESTNEK